MASHFRLGNGPAPLLTNQAVSSTTVYTSAPLKMLSLDDVGIQINAVGTMAGTFDVQCSADHKEDELSNVLVAGNWVSIVLPSTPTLSGASLSIYIDMALLSAPWLRVVYTNASGSGTINVLGVGKGLM